MSELYRGVVDLETAGRGSIRYAVDFWDITNKQDWSATEGAA